MTIDTALHSEPADFTAHDIREARRILGGEKLRLRLDNAPIAYGWMEKPVAHWLDGRMVTFFVVRHFDTRGALKTLALLKPLTVRLEVLRREEEYRDHVRAETRRTR
jgi:hypothetical protein